jgi:selenide,water dikinase
MAFVEPWVDAADSVSEDDYILLADAQTSGGLLISCAPDRLGALRRELHERGELGAEIGTVRAGNAGSIRVVPGL